MTAGKVSNDAAEGKRGHTEEREKERASSKHDNGLNKRLDEELAATFPASDAPTVTRPGGGHEDDDQEGKGR